jgi:hypothetical protein
VIHNGCTTAIQAVIAGKPVITFMPSSDDPKTTACLPNRVGIPAHTVDEVIRAIDQPGTKTDDGHWRRTISSLDTIARVTEMVDQEADDASVAVSPEVVRRLAAGFAASEKMRAAARVFLPERRRSYGKFMDLFDPEFFAQFGNLTQNAARHYDAAISARRMSKFCYAVLPATEPAR